MQEFTTPMMKQYQEIKKAYPDCLLFFRLGDFYELFLEDAHIGAQVLNITLTGRPKGRDGRIPMAGVPYHAVDSYLAKLVKAGYKVAICEQISEPNKKGLVERDVVRVVTPGTMLDEKSLEQKEHNYLVSVAFEPTGFAISACDISTGHLEVCFDHSDDWEAIFTRELLRIAPVEAIVSDKVYNNPQLIRLLLAQEKVNIYPYLKWETKVTRTEEILKKHFEVASLAAYEGSADPLTVVACGNLIAYLKETQKDNITHIRSITSSRKKGVLQLDRATIVNLELFTTIREHETRGTLLSVIDQTKTAMGGRKMKEIMKLPLASREKIVERHDAVSELIANNSLRNKVLNELSEMVDVERLLSKTAAGLGNARDLQALSEAISHIISTKHLLIDVKGKLLRRIQKRISINLHKVVNLIDKSIVESPPITLTDGGIIREGYDLERDNLNKLVTSGNEWLVEYEANERKKTGISTLKVRFNKVFGFYIEVSKGSSHLAPQRYIRKQTLTNGERFTTEELARHEEEIIVAHEKLKKLEHKLFSELREKILKYTEDIQVASEQIAKIDCLSSFATVAITNRYTRPVMTYSGEIRLKQARHPVVETLLTDHAFVANNCEITNVHDPVLIVTGPNMAGKSVFIRQVALIVYLAHLGSFVPAQSAHISMVDSIFVRSGASDIITSGLSTFMVEMVETAYILNHATDKSLIVMDEIGRGTSTYDGISIAWAIAEYLVTAFKVPPKTLFATHYHELQKLEEVFPRKIKNIHMAVSGQDDPVMLFTLADGPASHSFGISVAKKAGINSSVIKRAKEMLTKLESTKKISDDTKIKNETEAKIVSTLNTIDINTITPLEALNQLSKLKKMV